MNVGKRTYINEWVGELYVLCQTVGCIIETVSKWGAGWVAILYAAIMEALTTQVRAGVSKKRRE